MFDVWYTIKVQNDFTLIVSLIQHNVIRWYTQKQFLAFD
jgi:hypothetical protein